MYKKFMEVLKDNIFFIKSAMIVFFLARCYASRVEDPNLVIFRNVNGWPEAVEVARILQIK